MKIFLLLNVPDAQLNFICCKALYLNTVQFCQAPCNVLFQMIRIGRKNLRFARRVFRIFRFRNTNPDFPVKSKILKLNRNHFPRNM